MKTIQTTIILLLFSIAAQHLPAQTPTESRFIATKTHSIGFNLYPVIKNLRESAVQFPFEITYKYQPRGKDRAWRFGLLGQYNDFDEDVNLDQHYEESPLLINSGITQKEFKAGAYAGHEWQWTLGKRWLPVIGADVRYLYEQLSQWTYQTSSRSDAAVGLDGNKYSHGVSLQPFIGLNFAITSHWLLYIDFKVDFTCNYSTANSKDSRQEPISKYASKTTEFRFNLLPLQQINLIYTF
jgi:hypothetical protein